MQNKQTNKQTKTILQHRWLFSLNLKWVNFILTKLWKQERKVNAFAYVKKKKGIFCIAKKKTPAKHQKQNQKTSNTLGKKICNVYDGKSITIPNV